MARVKQEWKARRVTSKKGKKKIKLNMIPKKILPRTMKPMVAEAINMVEGMGEDEEEEFLRRNPLLVSLFEVDIVDILE